MDGIGLFTLESFKKIVSAHPEVEFVFIFDRTPHPDYIFAKNISAQIISPQARHPFLYIIWYQISLHFLLKKENPDVFIGTDGMIPLNTKTKTLAVIHDLNFEHNPKQLPFLLRKYYCKYFPKFAGKSTRIATVSKFSKNDICSTYKINENKIDVVYNGANINFKPVNEETKNLIKQKHTNNKDFFLFIGTLHPRKNLVNLFKAFNEFKIKTQSDFKLLIVGRKMWWTNEIETTYHQLEHKNDIIFAGRTPEEELYKITASAYALAYVPFFEGFGIPLVEAMKCGVPVITSNVTSMPEVVENAGILINPNNFNEITQAMIEVFTDKNYRKDLSERSISQAEKFSWEKTADLLWQSILKTSNA